MSVEAPATTTLPTRAFAVKTFSEARSGLNLRRPALVLAGLAGFLFAAFSFLVALNSPLAAFMAFAAGIAVRCAGQHRNLARAATSPEAAKLATSAFDGKEIRCSFEERAVHRYVDSWKLRIYAAVFAGCACLVGQHSGYAEFKLLPSMVLRSHWLFAAIRAAAPSLPVIAALFFLWCRGPRRRWSGQLERAIQRRAENAVASLLARSEIDGLQAGIDVLRERLGIERKGEYRRALGKHIEARTTELALTNASAQPLVDTLLELARQDLNHLNAALARYQEVECAWKSLQALASELRDPLREFRAQEFKAELEQLSRLASQRRWSDLQIHADWVLGELESLGSELRRHASAVPRLSLPPGSDPYRVLGVDVDTPTPLIKKLRVRLAQLYHPDVSESIANSTKMAEVNAAYDAVMKDREKTRKSA